MTRARRPDDAPALGAAVLAAPDVEDPSRPPAARRRGRRAPIIYRLAPAPTGIDPARGEAAIRAILRRYLP